MVIRLARYPIADQEPRALIAIDEVVGILDPLEGASNFGRKYESSIAIVVHLIGGDLDIGFVPCISIGIDAQLGIHDLVVVYFTERGISLGVDTLGPASVQNIVGDFELVRFCYGQGFVGIFAGVGIGKAVRVASRPAKACMAML
jgi:hypothetical protein